MYYFILYFSIFMVMYIYVGYPILILLLGHVRRKTVQTKPNFPSATIVIAAYNEAACIETTLKNKLNLNYPKDALEIIVVSDGSTDGTDQKVEQFGSSGVRLIRQEPRSGKTAALNKAVKEANGEIIIFSDANSLYDDDAVTNLLENFSDSTVGYVTGKMIYTNPDGTITGDGCSAYMKYENKLREWETLVGSVVGVDGGIDAVRKSLYQPMRNDQLPDFVLPLKVVAQGFRVVFEPRALLKESSLSTVTDEYQMRVRVSLRAFWALFDMRKLLLHKDSLIFSWQLWSHKVLRYMCFIFLIAAYFSNLLMVHSNTLNTALFILQNLAYLGALISLLLEKKGIQLKFLYIIHYFSLLNLAAMQAFGLFLLRQKKVLWTPRKG
jgi:cellulose synthase/poly-beta-1,6-N-acetylglucosamine synthase-like glycosyltransferase